MSFGEKIVMKGENVSIKHLIKQEMFADALITIDDQLFQEKYTRLQLGNPVHLELWKEKWELQLQKSTIFEITGNSHEAILLANEVFSESKNFGEISVEIQFTAIFAKIMSLISLWHVEKIEKEVKKAKGLIEIIQEQSILKYETYNALYQFTQASCYIFQSKYEEALIYLKRSLKVLQQDDDFNYIVGFGLTITGVGYGEMGLYTQALAQFQLSSDYNYQKGLQYNYIWSLRYLANCYCEKGELDIAEKVSLKALKLAQKRDNMILLGAVQSVYGRILFHKGDLKKAEELLLQAMKHLELSGSSYKDSPKMSLAQIYAHKGDYEQALELSDDVLKFYQKIGYKNGIGWSLDFIGVIYREKGEIQEAQGHFKESLSVRETLGNHVDTARTLFNLFLLSCEANDFQQAIDYLEKLKRLNDKLENEAISNRSELAEALILMKSRKMKDKAKAEAILSELTVKENIEGFLLILSLLNLFDLLITEWKASEDEETLTEIITLLNKLKKIAESEGIHPLFIEYKILLANISLIEGKIDLAHSLLNEAITISNDKKLNKLEEKATKFQKQVSTQVREWHQLLKTNASIAERIEKSEIFEYLKTAKRMVSLK